MFYYVQEVGGECLIPGSERPPYPSVIWGREWRRSMQTPDSEDLVSLTQDCWKLRVFPSLLRKSMEGERLWVDALRSWWPHEYNIKWFSLPSLFLRTAKRPRCDWGSLFSEHQMMLFPPGIHGHIVPISAPCCSYKPSKVLSPCLVHALSLMWSCLSSSPSLSNTTWQTPTHPL